tara:strand:+ start:3642 stop:4358 length:717 start_codon:yes stop_codon:yes gene_type:complete
MLPKIAILGCGNLGYAIAKSLSQQIGENNLILTNNKKHLLEKYSKEFPNITSNNQEAVDKSDIICLLVRPQDLSNLLNEIKIPKTKLIINFTPKKIKLDQPLIHVACSPIINGRIRSLVYEKGTITPSQFNQFKQVFEAVTNHFVEGCDAISELATMSQIYVHLTSYYDLLTKQELNPKTVKAYFDLAFNSLEKPKQEVRTKKGLTDALFSFQTKNLPKFIASEKKVLEKRIKTLQED